MNNYSGCLFFCYPLGYNQLHAGILIWVLGILKFVVFHYPCQLVEISKIYSIFVVPILFSSFFQHQGYMFSGVQNTRQGWHTKPIVINNIRNISDLYAGWFWPQSMGSRSGGNSLFSMILLKSISCCSCVLFTSSFSLFDFISVWAFEGDTWGGGM